MKKEEIKLYFDEFVKQNEITMSAYSYFYFLMMELLNPKKECSVLKHPDKDAIFIFYKRSGKTYYPFLPIVKFKINESTKEEYIEIIRYFADKLKLKDIEFVPNELYGYLMRFKTKPLDHTYLYDSANFVKLEGHKNKPIRRYKNKYIENHKDAVIIPALIEHRNQINRLLEDWKHEAKDRLFRLFDSTKNKNLLSNLDVDNGVKRYDYVLIANNNVDAYVCFYEIYPNTKMVVLSTIKARHFVENNDGITEYFFSETLKLMNEKGYSIVNHGSDMNLKGLRAFKLKLNPQTILPNYMLIL